MLCDGWGLVITYCAATDAATSPNRFQTIKRFEYQMKIVLSRRHLAPNRCPLHIPQAQVFEDLFAYICPFHFHFFLLSLIVIKRKILNLKLLNIDRR